MELINGRYKIEEQLQKDRFTTSYSAIDMFKSNTKIIMILFEPELSHSQLIKYFKNEFIFLNSIEHDMILKDESFDVIYSVDNKESKIMQYFYTREYFSKETMSYMNLSENESINIFYKICCIVRYLHFRGICYNHLNMDNVLIFKEENGLNIKLNDIAYIKQMNYERGKIAHYNHQFFSPEYQMGVDADFSSDIFSLGVILFYLYYGMDYRISHFKDSFEHYKHSSFDINNMINRMTTFESTERYRSVKDVICEIEKLFSIKKSQDINKYERINFKTKLVNREREINHVTSLVESLNKPNTKTMCLMIEGEEGIGKSRLVKEILYRLRLDKTDNYFSSYDQINEISHKTFRGIIKQMLRNAHYDLIQKYGSELVKIIPSMSQIWDIKPSPVLMEEKEKLRLYDRIFHFVNDYIGNRPTIIIIENIHYADLNTIELVDYFIRNEKKIPILFIVSFKPQKGTVFFNFLDKWTNLECIHHIQLTKFNLEETATHIQNILGMTWKPLELATRLMKTTEGNPRYIEEVIKDLFIKKYIAINKDWIWVARDVDDIYDLQLPSNIDEAMLGQIKSYDKTNLEVLKVISTFHSSVSAEVIEQILNINKKVLQGILTGFVMIKVVNEKLEDWGYTYDFYNSQLKIHIYNTIEDNEKSNYHTVASNILEDYYKKEGRENKDELIHHFTKCGKLSKAIDYCLEAADKMLELNIYAQALDFYWKAVDLLNKNNDNCRKIDILYVMGKIYFQIGENDKAIDVYHQMVELGHEIQYKKAVIDGKNKLGDLYVLKNKLKESLAEIDDTKALSQKMSYHGGYLEALYIYSKILLKKNDFKQFEITVKEGLKESLNSNNDQLVGHFLNQRGKLYRTMGNYEEAMLDFIESINYYEKASHIIDSISPINNIGVVLIEGLQDTELARTYYMRALRIAEKYNLVAGTNIYYLNIGETYLIEDQFDMAINYFNKAIEVSEETEDKNVLLLLYVYMSDLFLNKKEYRKAYNYLKKAEIEDGKEIHHRRDRLEFSLLKIKFYKAIGALRLALSELEKAERNFLEMDKYSCFIIKTYRFLLNPDLAIDNIFNRVIQLLEEVETEPFVKQKRLFSLDIASLLINKGYLNEAGILLDYDEVLSHRVNTGSLENRRKLLLGYFNENKIEYYESLLAEGSNYKCLECEWKIHRMLGDQYFISNEFYKAVNSYIYALDILKRLVLKVPQELQLIYMNSNPSKLDIKRKIEILRGIILDETTNDITCIEGNELTNENLDNYFDFSELQMLFQNERFLETALKEYDGFFSSKVSSIRELMQQLTADDLQNMQCVLKYCIKISLATKGFIIIVDKKYQTQQIINISEHHDIHDIDILLEKVTQKKEGVLIKNRYDINFLPAYEFLPGTSQAAICIPIMQNMKKEKIQIVDQRKKWNSEREDKILGFLYLETDKVFNNFEWTTYKTCEALTNLLSVLIDNYKLKIASSVDRLTNVLVRKHIEKALKNEIEKSEINKTVFSIIMGDIDKFKQVNDLFGHQQGDHVLRQVGRIMKDNLRNSDKVGRYGGEEFIIILPQTEKEEAQVVSEKIRNSIEESLLVDGLAVTMSFGISTYPEHGIKDDELIEKADQALYYAKESGRNRSIIWNKDMGASQKRVDKLAGIISGNLAQDHRIVQVIVEIMELVKHGTDKETKLFEIMGRLIEITEAKNGVYIEINDHEFTKVYCRERYKENWVENVHVDWKTADRVKKNQVGEFYIDWDNIFTLDSFTGTPDWQSRIVLPIQYLGNIRGILQLSVPIKEKEFDFNTFNFINSLTGIIGSIV